MKNAHYGTVVRVIVLKKYHFNYDNREICSRR